MDLTLISTSNLSMASLAALPFFLFFSLLFISVNAISASNYTQALDHFGHDKSTFLQQYLINNTDWEGAENRTPILVFLGGESPISSYVSQIGLINEAAPHLQALVVYIEVCVLTSICFIFEGVYN